ncbi:MAG: hypothetical protein L6R42_008650 [Xanthoria sp. 1 TBL-2021]|nr:MAG: hypothetical protein L6R42_008650 [Xanthoria sp. 1 TBL-2021]
MAESMAELSPSNCFVQRVRIPETPAFVTQLQNYPAWKAETRRTWNTSGTQYQCCGESSGSRASTSGSVNIRTQVAHLSTASCGQVRPSESPFKSVITHEQDRWAAKEATIKASRQRKLLLKDISIVQCNSHGRVHALIAPEHATDIVMSSEVATKRGLSEAQSPGAGTVGQVVNGLFVSNAQTVSRHGLDSRFFLRKAKIKDEEQQIAEISISHDNEYAVAVCMSLAEDSHSRDRPQCIIDDGLGEPLHEPEWGDSGYLEGGNLSSTGNN